MLNQPRLSRCIRNLLAMSFGAALALSGCGGDGGSAPPPVVTTYSVGGTVAGLAGSGLVLQNNGADDLTISGNGAFSFATQLATGAAYSVTVKTQPSVPGQDCTVSNGSGNVAAANITNVAVSCTTPSARFAYVTSEAANTVAANQVNASTGALTAGASISTGLRPLSVAVDPSGKFAYVANFDGNSVSAYTINQASGALTQVGGEVAAGTGPNSVTVDPTGKFAYVANGRSNNLSAYAINAGTGALAPVAGSPFASGLGPVSVVIHPSGKFAYAANQGASPAVGTVSSYTIDAATGALAPIAGSPLPAGINAVSIAVDPTGKFAYVVNSGDASNSGSVWAYSIDAGTGALSPLAAGAQVAAGNTPWAIAVDPTGKFAFVTNLNGGNVTAFAINATTGALAAVAGSPFTTGSSPRSVTVDAAGKYVYVANSSSNDVTAFALDAASGALTPIFGSPFAAAAAPSSVTTTP